MVQFFEPFSRKTDGHCGFSIKSNASLDQKKVVCKKSREVKDNVCSLTGSRRVHCIIEEKNQGPNQEIRTPLSQTDLPTDRRT